jgi:hypothetical protein
MPQIYDMGQDRLLRPLPKGRRADDFFFALKKIRRLRPGLNPRTWGTKNQRANSRPPNALELCYFRFEEDFSVIYSVTELCNYLIMDKFI